MITSSPGLQIAVDLGLDPQQPISCESGINLFVHLEVEPAGVVLHSLLSREEQCSPLVCRLLQRATLPIESSRDGLAREHSSRELPEPSGSKVASGEIVASSLAKKSVHFGETTILGPLRFGETTILGPDDNVNSCEWIQDGSARQCDQDVDQGGREREDGLAEADTGKRVVGPQKQCRESSWPSDSDGPDRECVNSVAVPLEPDVDRGYASLSFKEKSTKEIVNFRPEEVFHEDDGNYPRRHGKGVVEESEDEASDEFVPSPYSCAENRSWSPVLEDLYFFGDMTTDCDRAITAGHENEMRKTMEVVFHECPTLPISPDTLLLIQNFKAFELSAALLLLDMSSCEVPEDVPEADHATTDKGDAVDKLGFSKASDVEGKSMSSKNKCAAFPVPANCAGAVGPSNFKELQSCAALPVSENCVGAVGPSNFKELQSCAALPVPENCAGAVRPSYVKEFQSCAALPRLESCVGAAEPSHVKNMSWMADDSPRIDCGDDSTRTFGLKRIKPKRTNLGLEITEDVNDLVVLDSPSRKRLRRSLDEFERRLQSVETVHLL